MSTTPAIIIGLQDALSLSQHVASPEGGKLPTWSLKEAALRLDELERENARLKRELVKIAASKTAAELDEDQYDSADFEGGYGILIDIARAALAGSSEPGGSKK